MSDKVIKAITLAFDKSANENEALAAFRAAKRLLGDKPISDLFGAERVVYRERVERPIIRSWELKFSSRFNASLIKHMINDAAELNLKLNVTKFTIENNSCELHVRVEGDDRGVKSYDARLDDYFDQMKGKTTAPKTSQPRQEPPKPKAQPYTPPPEAPRPEAADRPDNPNNRGSSSFGKFFKGLFR